MFEWFRKAYAKNAGSKLATSSNISQGLEHLQHARGSLSGLSSCLSVFMALSQLLVKDSDAVLLLARSMAAEALPEAVDSVL